MTPQDHRWDNLSDDDWSRFADCWIAELNGRVAPPLPDLPVLFPNDPETSASEFVVPMNFTASSDAQWRFIEAVFDAGDDEAMGHLAAGPVEHLLSKHGDEYISRFEQRANADPRFANMLAGCNRLTMNDNVWRRLQAARGDDVG